MNDQELLRYSRHIMLPELDIVGQEKLLAARVMVLGLGGLGSPIALYLAAAGIGKLVLVDHDQVDASNLQRQIVHVDANIGHSKVESAAQQLRALRPDIDLRLINERLGEKELDVLLPTVDLVVDGTDNLAIRYALNDACLRHKVPWVSGAAVRFEGQIAVFDPRNPESPCYRCLFPSGSDEGQRCAENGVIAPLVGVIGTLQALEAIKVITGVGTTLCGSLLLFDAMHTSFHRLKLPRHSGCPACGA